MHAVSGTTRSVPSATLDNKSPTTCYPGVDTSHCPRCAPGYYCDGLKCVLKSECPCMIENGILRVSRKLMVKFHVEYDWQKIKARISVRKMWKFNNG